MNFIKVTEDAIQSLLPDHDLLIEDIIVSSIDDHLTMGIELASQVVMDIVV